MTSTANRPLSPHIQVYRLPLPAVMSITHRMASVANFVGLFVLIWWLGAMASGAEAYAEFTNHTSTWYGQLALVGWTFTLFYNMAHDVRHLFWDFDKGFELTTAYKAAFAICAFSIGATVLTWHSVWANILL